MTTTRRKLLGVACAVPAAGLAQKKQRETPKVLYSRARAWRDLVFLSGHGVADDGGAGVQTKIVLDQIEAELKAAGSAMDKVLKVNVYLATLDDYAAMNKAFAGRFGDEPPVRTTVAVAGIPLKGCLVEIDVIAHR